MIKNPWLKKEVGTVRYTSMIMMEDVFHLPARFKIKESGKDSFRCFRKPPDEDGPWLTWKSKNIVEFEGKEYKLKYSPACNTGGTYVFTLLDSEQ